MYQSSTKSKMEVMVHKLYRNHSKKSDNFGDAQFYVPGGAQGLYSFSEGLRQRRSELYREAYIPEVEAKPKKKKYKPYPTLVGFVIPIIGTIIIQLVVFINGKLPAQVLLTDEVNQPDRFIGERAERHLTELIGDGTPRVTGSYENEQLAVNYLQRQVDLIKQQAVKIHKIEYELQEPIGSYYLGLRPYGLLNSYDQIKNFVVRLSSDQDSGHSVLVNCHFDTVPESPGASDNGLNCAVMLEILRKLSQRDRPLKHNVIFLFNGAEENPLQASHGFIAHHKWAGECRVIVNLDSAGAGGREILFQASTKYPWLTKMYADVVPRPSGNVIAEELFQSGVIPSDTDFRVFRDFGNLSGYDFAHNDNAYIYHTRLDKQDYISGGVYQHTGDNMLTLIKSLAETDHLCNMNNVDNDSPFIYYDFFGAFIVVYSQPMALFFHIVAIFFSIVSIVWTYRLLPNVCERPWSSFTIGTFVQIVNWLFTLGVMLAIAKLLDALKATMGWHAQLMVIATLYGTPLLWCGAIFPYILTLFYQTQIPKDEIIVVYMTGVQFIFTILLLGGTVLQLRSSFLLLMFVAFPAIVVLILQAFKLYNVSSAVIAYSIAPLVPIVYSMYVLVKAIIFFAPVTARSGVFSNPELTVSVLVFISGIMSSSYATPLFLLFKSPHKIAATLFLINMVTLGLIIASPFGFPYSGDLSKPALQRFYFLHSERTMHDVKDNVIRHETGYWLIPMDRNDLKYVSKVVPELADPKPVGDDCESELYCGLPVFLPRMARDAPYSYWIPGGPPSVRTPTKIEVVKRSLVDPRTVRIEFKASGADHITVLVSPVKNVQLINWSFDNSTPPTGIPWGDRSTYMLYYSTGRDVGLFQFHIDLKVPNNFVTTDPVVNYAVVGSYTHHPEIYTDEYKQFYNKFPLWTNIYRWVATYSSHIV